MLVCFVSTSHGDWLTVRRDGKANLKSCFGDCAVIWVFLKRSCTILPPKIAMFMKFGGFPNIFRHTHHLDLWGPPVLSPWSEQHLHRWDSSHHHCRWISEFLGFLHVFTHPEFLASLKIYFRYWKILNRLGPDGLGVSGFSFHSRTSALRQCLIGPAPTLDLLWGFA